MPLSINILNYKLQSLSNVQVKKKIKKYVKSKTKDLRYIMKSDNIWQDNFKLDENKHCCIFSLYLIECIQSHIHYHLYRFVFSQMHQSYIISLEN